MLLTWLDYLTLIEISDGDMWDLLDGDIGMTESQFALALKNKKLRHSSYKILRRILVDKIDKDIVIAEESILRESLTRMVKAVLLNYQKQIKKAGLVGLHVVVHKDSRAMIEKFESHEVQLFASPKPAPKIEDELLAPQFVGEDEAEELT
jgi:TrfB plasmid transcriptional repressor